MVDISFGALFKALRARKRLTLRKAALLLEYDPGNLSKIERNHLPPPASRCAVDELIDPFSPTDFERKLLYSAAINFHLGKLQERFL